MSKQILEFSVRKQKITWENPGRVPVERTRGFLYARFAVDEEWSGLSKTAVFVHGSGKTVSVPVDDAPVAVPEEVLAAGRLFVGLVGLGDGGGVRLTTKKMVRPVPLWSASPTAAPAAEAITPAAWERVLGSVGDLSRLETRDRSNLVAAVNEVLGSGGSALPAVDGTTLVEENGVLRVNTTEELQQDSGQPVTSAAIYALVGRINAVLETI